jgi:hypothetical protein
LLNLQDIIVSSTALQLKKQQSANIGSHNFIAA